MKIKICMLLGLRYGENLRIVPQIGIASYITNFGHNVTWILSSGKIKEVYETTFNEVHVFIVPCRYSERVLKVITKALYAFRRMRFVFKNFKNERYNMIFVRDGVFDVLLALFIKRIYKVPFVFELSNPLEQGWEQYKIESEKPGFLHYLIAKFNEFIATRLLYKADLILPISKWLKEHLVEQGIPESKIMPVSEGIDIEAFRDSDGADIREKYCLKSSRVIIYVGVMTKSRYLNVLIQAFAKVRKEMGKVKLLMVGEGADKSNLERLASKLGIKGDVIFTGQVYYDGVPNYIAAADVGVSAVPPLDFYKVSSPIKVFEYMALGKPVVANEEIPEHEEVIRESEGGILVKFEEESFANGIIKLLNDPERAKEMGRKGHEWVVKNRSYENMARQVEKRYFNLISQHVRSINESR